MHECMALESQNLATRRRLTIVSTECSESEERSMDKNSCHLICYQDIHSYRLVIPTESHTVVGTYIIICTYPVRVPRGALY